jgi:hypothetical protein
MPYPVRKADHGSIKRLCRATLGFKSMAGREKTGPEGPAKSIREAKRLGEAPRVPRPAWGRTAGAEAPSARRTAAQSNDRGALQYTVRPTEPISPGVQIHERRRALPSLRAVGR